MIYRENELCVHNMHPESLSNFRGAWHSFELIFIDFSIQRVHGMSVFQFFINFSIGIVKI